MQLHSERHTMDTHRNGEVDTTSTLESFQNAIGDAATFLINCLPATRYGPATTCECAALAVAGPFLSYPLRPESPDKGASTPARRNACALSAFPLGNLGATPRSPRPGDAHDAAIRTQRRRGISRGRGKLKRRTGKHSTGFLFRFHLQCPLAVAGPLGLQRATLTTHSCTFFFFICRPPRALFTLHHLTDTLLASLGSFARSS